MVNHDDDAEALARGFDKDAVLDAQYAFCDSKDSGIKLTGVVVVEIKRKTDSALYLIECFEGRYQYHSFDE